MATTQTQNGAPTFDAAFEQLKTTGEEVLAATRKAGTLYLDSYEKAVAKLKCVLDCHLVAGDFDYFLKIRAGDVDDFKRIHGDQLIALPGVRQTRTFFVMKEVVDNAPLDF